MGNAEIMARATGQSYGLDTMDMVYGKGLGIWFMVRVNARG